MLYVVETNACVFFCQYTGCLFERETFFTKVK